MIDYSFYADFALIFISGSACLYCGMLNRRLRKLQNLKTGVGASIVSLTEAITQTNKAAKDAQTSTLQTVETLRHLLAQAESAAPKIDALIVELVRNAETAQAERSLLTKQIDDNLSPMIRKAESTASGLLQVVTELDTYVNRIAPKALTPDTPAQTFAQNRPRSTDIFKVVSS